MPTYSVRVHDVSRERRDDVTREIAATVLQHDDRSVDRIHIEALPGLEHTDSFQRICDRVGLEYEDEYLSATFENDDLTESVLDLFSTSLVRAIFSDGSGDEIFARHEHSSVSFSTDPETFEAITAELDEELRSLVHQTTE